MPRKRNRSGKPLTQKINTFVISDTQYQELLVKRQVKLLVADFNHKVKAGPDVLRIRSRSGEMSETYIASITEGVRLTTIVLRLLQKSS